MSGSITDLGWINLGKAPGWVGSAGGFACFQDNTGFLLFQQKGAQTLFYAFDALKMKWSANPTTYNGTYNYLIGSEAAVAILRNPLFSVWAIRMQYGGTPPIIGNLQGGDVAYDFSVPNAIAYAGFDTFNQYPNKINSDPLSFPNDNIRLYTQFAFTVVGGLILGYNFLTRKYDVAFTFTTQPAITSYSFVGGLAPRYPCYPNTMANNGTFFDTSWAFVPVALQLEQEGNYYMTNSTAVNAPGPYIDPGHIKVYQPLYLKQPPPPIPYTPYTPSNFMKNGLAIVSANSTIATNSTWSGNWITNNLNSPTLEIIYYSGGFVFPIIIQTPTGNNSGTCFSMGPGGGLPFYIDGNTGNLYALDFTLRKFALQNTINLSRDRKE